MTRTAQIAIWLGLWCFWVGVSRHNHPTLLIDGVATALLLLAFAAAVYLNHLVLIPRFWKPGRFLAYWASLLLAINVLTALDVVAIQTVYDILWGPDPNRFGFWVNYGLEFTGIVAHLLAAAGVVWLTGWVRRRRNGTV